MTEIALPKNSPHLGLAEKVEVRKLARLIHRFGLVQLGSTFQTNRAKAPVHSSIIFLIEPEPLNGLIRLDKYDNIKFIFYYTWLLLLNKNKLVIQLCSQIRY